MLKEHEKFWAFVLLMASILTLSILSIFWPIPEGSGTQRILDAAVGGLLLALGGAGNALFRISNATEQQAIGEATAKAIQAHGVPVTNTDDNPVPTEDASELIGEPKPAIPQPPKS